MANGVPVVCTPVGGLPQLIVDGHNGLFCALGNPGSVADKITLLLENSALSSSIAKEGMSTVERSNGIEVVEKKLRNLWTSIDRRGASTHRSELSVDR
jgi:glycosyltransferase involved in cell wall biosynthesis